MMLKISAKFRLWVANIFDFFVYFLSFPLALLLRFNEFSINGVFVILVQNQGILILSSVMKLISFAIFRVSRGLWRFASIPDLKAIVFGTLLAEVLTVFVMFFANRMSNIPRSVFVIDMMITVYLMGGGRLLYRLLKQQKRKHNGKNGKKTIVIGAGAAAEKLLREYESMHSDFEIVGLLDDSESKIGRTLLGHKILGSIAELPNIIDRLNVLKVIIAIPSLSSLQIRSLLSSVNNLRVEIVTIPSFKDIVNGKISLSDLRPLDVNDLLGRDPVVLNLKVLTPAIKDKVIIVTGAGGSIGSELVRQIACLSPKLVILFDMSEFFLYELERKIKQDFPLLNYKVVIGDVRDRSRLEKVFKDLRPEICYHAAAYKHVPLMEANPHEAIKTNIFGTKNLLEVATKSGLKKFVLISTDKAVRPTSVMGATKKVAEMICQKFAEMDLLKSSCEIVVVRFGNVLASNGSVVPLFLEQIKAGGPVTVTHRDMTRYFMSIPEATQLVMQAGAIGSNGNILVLDMGEPVKIWDLATQLIHLNGLLPGVDIEIKEVGMRPGEKMYEELFYDSEKLIETQLEKIFVSTKHQLTNQLWDNLTLLQLELESLSSPQVKERLCQLISIEAENIQEYLQ